MTHEKAIVISSNRPIVIVDDDDTEHVIMRHILAASKLKNELLFFHAGPDFLTHMTAVGQQETAQPALVLLDINMPTMSGFEVLEKLRATVRFTEFPVVVMLSSSDAELDKRRASELGANGYIVKLAGISAFIDMINRTFVNTPE